MKYLSLIFLTFIILLAGLLRFYKIDVIPPGLYIDEASIGVNAYDILTKGKDQNGISHPLAFATFGEYKLPVYIYSTALSMGAFGKNEFAIRFSSALFGTLTVLALFAFLREMFLLDKKMSPYATAIGLFGSLLLAITPWHIHFSRGGFEATQALFFYTVALWVGVRFSKTNKLWNLLIAVFALIIPFYTYDAYRLLVPLTALAGFFLLFQKKEYRKNIIFAGVFVFVLAMPMVVFSFFQGGLARLSQTSAFTENPYAIGYQRYFADFLIYMHNYLSYFSVTYLFRFGDQINRHQVNDLGILYLWQIPFLIAGLYFLTKTTNKILKWVLVFLLLVGPIPASLARPSPHALRDLFSVFPFTILTAVGLYQFLLQKGKWLKPFLLTVLLFALVEFAYYIHYYYIHYPQEALLDWGGGCKSVAMQIQKEQKQFQHVVIDKNVDCVSDYFTFYIPQIPVLYVEPGWAKPKTWGKTLYIRPFYGNKKPDGLVRDITLPNLNHDIFVQFYTL